MEKKTNKITALMDALKGVNTDKLTLTTRKLATGDWWYIRNMNSKPYKWHSIGTTDGQIAQRVWVELTSDIDYGCTEIGAKIQIEISKLNRDIRERTWNDVHLDFISMGQRESTIATYRSNWNLSAFDRLKGLLLVSTTKQDMVDVYKNLHGNAQSHLRTLFNHANKNGWLIDSTIMPLVLIESYSKGCGGTTATINEEQHLKIVAAMGQDLANWDTTNRRMQRRSEELLLEVKSILEVLWELGSSNADTRELETGNINWETGHVVFKRKKWKGTGAKNKRTRQPIHFPMSAKLKEVIRPWYDDAMKNGGGHLFPYAAKTQSANVSRIFEVYMKVAGVPKFAVDEDGQERKLIIHSYRYRMAEHLFEIGATEAEAKALMGWQSREVMLAYAKGMKMNIPALDVMAKERGQDKIIPMEKVA